MNIYIEYKIHNSYGNNYLFAQVLKLVWNDETELVVTSPDTCERHVVLHLLSILMETIARRMVRTRFLVDRDRMHEFAMLGSLPCEPAQQMGGVYL